MIMGGNNDDDGHRDEFDYNVHDYDYDEDKYYKDDDRHHTQVKFSWLVDNQEVEGGVDRPHLLILPGLTRLVDEDRNGDYDPNLIILTFISGMTMEQSLNAKQATQLASLRKQPLSTYFVSS